MNRLTLLKPSSPFSRSLLRSPHPHPHPHPHPSTIRFASSSQSTRSAIGAFTLPSALLFSLTGLGLYYYFQHEKGLQQERKLAETANAKIGKPKIGGEFVLTDQDGKEWGSKDMKGKWCLVYFGFTNCPDICPEELDKMTLVVSAIEKSHKVSILPVFITCDPVRDTVPAVKAYIKDFHPSMIGLTGTYDEIKKTAKAYRVYFSTPPTAKPTDDYLVDHSIFFYLMDPNGGFVDAFGRSMSEDVVKEKIGGYLEGWQKTGGKWE